MMQSAKDIASGATYRSLNEVELEDAAGGRIKLPRPEPFPGPSGGGAGEPLEAQPWSSNPIYLPF
jgi:hypothetical protein